MLFRTGFEKRWALSQLTATTVPLGIRKRHDPICAKSGLRCARAAPRDQFLHLDGVFAFASRETLNWICALDNIVECGAFPVFGTSAGVTRLRLLGPPNGGCSDHKRFFQELITCDLVQHYAKEPELRMQSEL